MLIEIHVITEYIQEGTIKEIINLYRALLINLYHVLQNVKNVIFKFSHFI